jgi:ADP-heptose:LPS heptosyltransferase
MGSPKPERVVVFRALKLGDMLCAMPALHALRAALPQAKITLLGMPWAECLLRRFPKYLDAFQSFPGFPGLPEQTPEVNRRPRFLDEMHAQQFDLAVEMHGSGSFVNPVTALLGARHMAGFYVPGDYCPDPDRFVPYPDQDLEVRRLLALTRFWGCPDVGEHLEFPVRAADFSSLKKAIGDRPLFLRRYVCLHVGASVPERRWHVQQSAYCLMTYRASFVTAAFVPSFITVACAKFLQMPS